MKEFPPSLAVALRNGLTPGGIFVLGSCGYYYDGNDAAYQAEWTATTKAIAAITGRGFYASPGKVEPNPSTDASTFRDNAQRIPSPFLGFDPYENRLPIVGHFDANCNPLP